MCTPAHRSANLPPPPAPPPPGRAPGAPRAPPGEAAALPPPAAWISSAPPPPPPPPPPWARWRGPALLDAVDAPSRGTSGEAGSSSSAEPADCWLCTCGVEEWEGVQGAQHVVREHAWPHAPRCTAAGSPLSSHTTQHPRQRCSAPTVLSAASLEARLGGTGAGRAPSPSANDSARPTADVRQPAGRGT